MADGLPQFAAYADSELLASLYVRRKTTPMAIAAVKSVCPPLPLTPIHELEVHTIFRFERTINRITDSQLAAALEQFESDISAGRLIRLNCKWNAVITEAEAISKNCDPEALCPPSDILHLAMVNLLRITELLTFKSW